MNINQDRIYSKNITLLLLICGIQSVCSGISFHISLFMKENIGLDGMQIGALISTISIGNIVGGYLGGYIADKHNPLSLLKYGLMIQGSSLLFLVYTSNFYAMSLLMLFMGLGSYLYITSSHYILNSIFNKSPTDRVNIISMQAIITNVGMLLSAILMGYCAEGYYVSIFNAIAFLMLIVALASQRIKLDVNEISAICKNNHCKIEKIQYCILGLLSIGTVGMMYSFHRVGYPIFLSNIFGNIGTGYLMAVNPLIIIFFQNYIAKKFSKRNELLAICTGLFLFSTSFLILNISSTIYQILLSCCILTIGEILSTTYAQSIVFGYSPSKMRGRILGLYKSTYSVTKLIGSYAAGSILYYSGYNMLWLISGIIGFTIFFVILSFYFKDRNQVFSSL